MLKGTTNFPQQINVYKFYEKYITYDTLLPALTKAKIIVVETW